MRAIIRSVRLNRANAPWLVGTGLAAGMLSGFFGIGGGFLIVPGLVFATGMPMLQAVGSSLVGVTAFGATAALTYGRAGLVDVPIAMLFVAGGALVSMLAMPAAGLLAARRGLLTRVFADVVILVAVYVLGQVAGRG